MANILFLALSKKEGYAEMGYDLVFQFSLSNFFSLVLRVEWVSRDECTVASVQILVNSM